MRPNFVRLFRLVEILGTIGLVLPAPTGILPILTLIAAAGLVLLVLTAFVAYGRFVAVPLA